MEFNNQDQFNEGVIETKSKWPYIIGLIAITTCIVLAGIYFTTMSNNNNISNDDVVSEDFFAEIDNFGQLMSTGQYDEALVVANQLVAISDTNIERGRASLSLALAERQGDQLAAIERFKAISRNESFDPFVRAMAIWYTVEMNLGSRDSNVARDHIYTGDLWNNFVDTAYSDDPELMYRLAGIAALRASIEQSVTAQAAMRLAVESAALLQYDQFTSNYKNETAALVPQYITLAEQDLVEIRNLNVLHYAGTEYVVVASVLNGKALALDALYAGGYSIDEAQVTDAYEDALEAVIAYNLQTSHPYFIRYNYADFLARTSFDTSTSTIVAILQPMTNVDINSSFARYLANRLTGADGASRSDGYTGHPETMRLLASISPEFKAALLRIGLPESLIVVGESTAADEAVETNQADSSQ